MRADPPKVIRGYPVKVRRFEIAGGPLELLGPANFEELIDDPRVVERFARDEYMPYWAEFWPAAELLAEEVAKWGPAKEEGSGIRDPGSDDAPTVLEIGCGLGLAALVAARLGYDVTVSDYDDDALAFVEASARHNGILPPRPHFIDWREHYPDLRVDRIIAGEVLYERRNLEPIARFIRRHLSPGGFALICDAFRPTADDFPATCRGLGLTVNFYQIDKGSIVARFFTIKESS